MRTRLWRFYKTHEATTATWLLVGAALCLGGVGCSFDASRLDELRADNGVPDGGLPDAEGDGSPDLDANPGDLTDGGEDVPEDLPVDGPADQGGEVADQGDAADQGDDGANDLADQGDPGDDAGDASDAVDAPGELPNQPPVLTLPPAPQVEGLRSVVLLGIGLADPDAGAGDLALLLTANQGLVSLTSLPEGLELITGDGVRDSVTEVRGTLAELSSVLGGLVFHSTSDGPLTGSLRFDVDDLGNTGTGGAQQITEFLQIDVLLRVHDFRVQRGTAAMANNQGELTLVAGVDYEAPTGPAFVRLVNTRFAGMGRTSNGNTRDPEEWMVAIDGPLDLATSVVFRRPNDSQTCRVTWELLEYTGEPGGPNAFAVRQAAHIDYGSAETVAETATIAGIADDDDVVVFITGQYTESSLSGDLNLGLNTSEWNAGGDTATFERGEAGDVTRVSYAVVELTGSNWRIERVEHTYVSAAGSEPVVVDPVIDPARTFLHVQHRVAASLDRDTGALAWPAAVNALRFELQPQTTGFAETRTVAWLIGNSATGDQAMRVVHVLGTRSNTGAAEEDIWTETLASPVDNLAWSSVMGECAYVQGGSSNPPRGSIDVRLSAAGTVELRQSERDGNKTYRFSVVQWPDD